LILHRCFAWNERARAGQPDSPLWFPRDFQGDGRHDNPDVYGCLYLTDREVSGVVEQLARFRSQRLIEPMLIRAACRSRCGSSFGRHGARRPRRPAELRRRRLRRAGRDARPRDHAAAGARRHRDTGAAGIRWWSIHESLWATTLFDRSVPALSVAEIRPLELGDPAVAEAAEFLGLPPGST
jgi:hypothetical protein